MSIKSFKTALILSLCLSNLMMAQKMLPYKDAKLPVEKRIKDLLSRMTIEEKVGQLNQLNGGIMLGPKAEKDPSQKAKIQQVREGKISSFMNVVGAAETRAVQKIAIEESRLGIPLLFALDVIHGHKTVFPIPLAEACSWNLDLAKKTAEIAANEASSAGLHWVFAPMMDVSREPRWGRVMEGFGEDPYLGGLFAAARVRGYQGNMDNHHVVSCIKHFAAYGAPEGGREYNTVDMSHYTLWNMYLPPYKAAVDAGAMTVMNSFNIVDGVPASANKYLINDILRKRWGFKGLMVSDWGSFREMVAHGYVENNAEAAEKALLAGSQMDMESSALTDHLAKLVQDKKVPISIVDDAVKRVLEIKFKLGLFDNPYGYNDEKREAATLLSKENLSAAQAAACETMILLKNDNKTLPFSKNVKNVLVAGLFGDSQEDALDLWCGVGESKDVVSYLNGIRQKLPSANVAFAKSYEIEGKTPESLLTELDEKTKQAEIIVAVIGIKGQLAGEARALGDINPPAAQMEMLRRIKASGKPFVVLVHAGRPMILTEVQQLAPSILNAWLAGTMQGPAAADILFGDYNPSAKTTMSFPYAIGQIPVYYNCNNTGRPHKDGEEGPDHFWVSRYRDIPNSALYPFGFGLSYSTFAYSDLKLSATEMAKNQQVTATVTLKNTSNQDGEEIAQLYIRDMVGSYVRPLKILKGFQKVKLKAGESKTLTFTIEPSMLSYFDDNGQTILEAGNFKIFVGGNSRDVLETDLKLK
jgi:beta-glucosidase